MRAGRGFSLVELAVTLTITATLSGLLVFWFSGNRDPGKDSEAKAALVAFSTLQDDALRRGEDPLDAATLNTGPYDRGTTRFTATTSTEPQEVAVILIENEVVIGAAAAGLDCWGVRLDFTPSSTSPRSWWFVAIDEPVCSPALFEDAAFPADGTGQRPSKPTILG